MNNNKPLIAPIILQVFEEDMARGGRKPRWIFCEQCGYKRILLPTQVIDYRTTGWPVHCDERMQVVEG